MQTRRSRHVDFLLASGSDSRFRHTSRQLDDGDDSDDEAQPAQELESSLSSSFIVIADSVPKPADESSPSYAASADGDLPRLFKMQHQSVMGLMAAG